MTIEQQIEEVMELHNRYAVIRYPDYHASNTMSLQNMFNEWHSKAATLFSRYLSNDDENLVRFKNIKKGNCYVNAGLFNEIETYFSILIDKLRYTVFYQLESLIREGNEIEKTISFVNVASGTMRMYAAYRVEDESRYQTWKSKCIRLLNVNFGEDKESKAFVVAAKAFDESHYAPKFFKEMFAILKSCKEIPNNSRQKEEVKQDPPSPVTVNVSQNQTQNRSIEINIFLESIKEELTGKQFGELKSIAQDDPNPDSSRSKIVDKLKSLGADVLSNILATIVTSPSVWNCML